MNERIYKIGPVGLTEAQAREIMDQGRYIVTYSSVYQIHYSPNAGYYGQKLHQRPQKGGIGYARRGRFYALRGADVNRLVGARLVND